MASLLLAFPKQWLQAKSVWGKGPSKLKPNCATKPIPTLQGPDSLSYLNLRHELDDDDWAGFNAGLGLSHCAENWIVEAYGFVDRRETDFHGNYRQFSAGT